MQKDPTAQALHLLFVAQANYDMACAARVTCRELLDEAIRTAAAAGLSNAEIGRAIGATGQRVGQIIAEVN